jgi:hypothetical protein
MFTAEVAINSTLGEADFVGNSPYGNIFTAPLNYQSLGSSYYLIFPDCCWFVLLDH